MVKVGEEQGRKEAKQYLIPWDRSTSFQDSDSATLHFSPKKYDLKLFVDALLPPSHLKTTKLPHESFPSHPPFPIFSSSASVLLRVRLQTPCLTQGSGMVKCFVTISTYCKRYRVRKDDMKEIHFLKRRSLPPIPLFSNWEKENDDLTSCQEEEIKMAAEMQEPEASIFQ